MPVHLAARIVLVLALCAIAKTSFTVQGRLNHTQVQQAYLEADWNSLAKGLEHYLRKPDVKADRLDSLCALKYLAVIQVSRPETRLLGEVKFHRLLELDPDFESSHLADLFVSDDVLGVFRRVKREFRQTQPPPPPKPEPNSVSGPNASSDASAGIGKRRHSWVWIGAGGAAVAGALTAYFLFAGESQTGTKKIPVEL